jgi:hypothetical protein
VVAVDDFALRKGEHYATIIVDLETRRPIEVLRGREAGPLAEWLSQHPEIEIVCRDRARAYAEAARLGAPQARQVADRWHLLHNLTEAVEKTVSSHYGCIKSAYADLPKEPESEVQAATLPDRHLDVRGRDRNLVARTTDRYLAVQELVAQGRSLKGISRDLSLDYYSARRYARASSLEELLAKAVHRVSLLDDYKAYLFQRVTDGCGNALQLSREIHAQGFRGSSSTVGLYVRLLKQGAVPVPAPRAVPRPRKVTKWIMANPDNLRPDDLLDLNQIRVGCPELACRHGMRSQAQSANTPRNRVSERDNVMSPPGNICSASRRRSFWS